VFHAATDAVSARLWREPVASLTIKSSSIFNANLLQSIYLNLDHIYNSRYAVCTDGQEKPTLNTILRCLVDHEMKLWH
jgi:hypothetical protein